MGAGASVKRSPSSLRTEIERLRERELNAKEEGLKEHDKNETKKDAKIAKLQSERDNLAQQVSEMMVTMSIQEEGWNREKNKTLALTYSNLPLTLISEQDSNKSHLLAKTYPLVTVAQCDVVGFSSLSASLKPQQVIVIIDHLHALMEESFHHEDILITEKNSDGCIAASGLDEHVKAENPKLKGYYGSLSSLSVTDSSYESEPNLLVTDHDIPSGQHEKSQQSTKNAAYYANILATSVLRLMSASSKVHVPLRGRNQLQLRIALHSGPCSAGVLGLQTSLGSNRIPEFKVMGPTLQYVNILCRTGLALQIKVSKESKALLDDNGEFTFERCPDYMGFSNRKPVESYWLVGQTNLSVKLPSLDLAIPLSSYDDIDV